MILYSDKFKRKKFYLILTLIKIKKKMKKLANSVIIWWNYCSKKNQNDNSTCHTHFVSFDVRHIVTNNLGSTWSLFMHGLICMCQYQSLPLGVFELFDNFMFEIAHQLCYLFYHLLSSFIFVSSLVKVHQLILKFQLKFLSLLFFLYDVDR